MYWEASFPMLCICMPPLQRYSINKTTTRWKYCTLVPLYDTMLPHFLMNELLGPYRRSPTSTVKNKVPVDKLWGQRTVHRLFRYLANLILCCACLQCIRTAFTLTWFSHHLGLQYSMYQLEKERASEPRVRSEDRTVKMAEQFYAIDTCCCIPLLFAVTSVVVVTLHLITVLS